jgi:hypothetical protein
MPLFTSRLAARQRTGNSTQCEARHTSARCTVGGWLANARFIRVRTAAHSPDRHGRVVAFPGRCHTGSGRGDPQHPWSHRAQAMAADPGSPGPAAGTPGAGAVPVAWWCWRTAAWPATGNPPGRVRTSQGTVTPPRSLTHGTGPAPPAARNALGCLCIAACTSRSNPSASRGDTVRT